MLEFQHHRGISLWGYIDSKESVEDVGLGSEGVRKSMENWGLLQIADKISVRMATIQEQCGLWYDRTQRDKAKTFKILILIYYYSIQWFISNHY